jgi:hypothetical protein
MLLNILLLLSLALSGAQAHEEKRDRSVTENDIAEAKELLRQIPWPDSIIDGVPHSDRIDRIREQLLLLAKRSDASRKSVIDLLVLVLKQERVAVDFDEMNRWRFAAALLGELNATEAIDDLVRSIQRPHAIEPNLEASDRYALVRIGAPAVPRLLRALSESNTYFPWVIAETLSQIGTPAVDGLLSILAEGQPVARAGAAYALARIGGPKVRDAIKWALHVENDSDAAKYLEDAIKLLEHVECLNDPNKCR